MPVRDRGTLRGLTQFFADMTLSKTANLARRHRGRDVVMPNLAQDQGVVPCRARQANVNQLSRTGTEVSDRDCRGLRYCGRPMRRAKAIYLGSEREASSHVAAEYMLGNPGSRCW